MVYGAANQLIKFMVFTANFLIFVFGGFLFGFSLWANLDTNFDAHLRDFALKIHLDDRLVDEIARYQASLWILVAVGALLMLVGFLGCCGAACESFILLTLFAICLIILFLIELFVLVSIFTNRGQLLENLHSAFVKSSETKNGRKNLKPIETLLNCCGATIETKHKYINEDFCPGALANSEDCYTAISSKIDTTALLICGIGLLLIQFFSIIFSSALCSAFRERGPVYYA